MIPQTSQSPILLALVGENTQGQNVFLYPGDRVSIGRHSQNQLSFNDDEVSGKHCAITYGQTGFVIEDLGSSNGTFVDAKAINGPTQLQINQKVQVGLSLLKLFPPNTDLPQLPNTRLIRILGAGNQGRVYEARLSQEPTHAALKVMHSDLSKKDKIRCQREAELQAKLHHPAIARNYGLHEINGHLVLVSELIRGQSLKDFLVSNGPVGWKVAVELGAVAATAMAYAHKNGVLHRDLNPSNLVIEKESRKLKIIDFGLAKKATKSETSVGLTSQGVMIGTYAYMPKEAFYDGRDLDQTADVFSLAATLYELMTGTVPFPARTIGEHLAMREQPIPALSAEYPKALTPLFQRALHTLPSNTWQSSLRAFNRLLARSGNNERLRIGL
ncbi:MAG: serine/threonine-protein kinase [Planctomycetota bacterium]|nr:serine/threonine-protein kinase [Planctomycetota bacterium]